MHDKKRYRMSLAQIYICSIETPPFLTPGLRLGPYIVTSNVRCMDIIQEKVSRTDEAWKEIGLTLAHKFLLRAKPKTSSGETSPLDELKPILKGHWVPKPGKHAESVHFMHSLIYFSAYYILGDILSYQNNYQFVLSGLICLISISRA
jgi:hypothetical protein